MYIYIYLFIYSRIIGKHRNESLRAGGKAEVMDAYFGAPSEGGNGYSLGRVPMGLFCTLWNPISI